MPAGAIEQFEFSAPTFASLPKREKGRMRSVWDRFKATMDATEKHGTLVPPFIVAKLLDVSPQRVHVLLNEGRLMSVEVEGYRMVPAQAVAEYANSERKAGRPCKVLESTGVNGVKEVARVAMAGARERVAVRSGKGR
jgi:hypothetical protein